MKIYYIYHSCFIVETKNSFLIFDYYKSKISEGFEFKDLLNRILHTEKAVYIFLSHSHSDHYNSEILAWGKGKNNTYYIFSDDIKIYDYFKHMYFVKENEKISVSNAIINTFGSTDTGVSFLINIDNLNIFHAGDLNWWKWNDDTESEEKEMEDTFKKIIHHIANLNTYIDVAFFPVDSRLEENYLCGGEYFIKMLQPDVFIPMHFWDKTEITNDFIASQSGKTHGTKIIGINYPNQILIDDDL